MHEHTPLPSPGLFEPWTTPVHPSWAGRTGCGEPALSLVEGAEKHQQCSQNSRRAGASASPCTPELLQDARQNPSSKTFQGIIWILLFWYFSSSEPRTGIQVQTQQFQAPGTRTEPVIGSKMVNALKKKPLKTPRNQVLDVFLNMQLVILMTNPLLLLFPREHLCTQQNRESWDCSTGNGLRR